MANNNTAVMGKTKRSTDVLIEDAIAQQDSWLARRRSFTRRFLRARNSSVENNTVQETPREIRTMRSRDDNNDRSVLRDYWFPILCAFIVLLVTIWIVFARSSAPQKIVVLNAAKPVPVETVSKGTVKKISEPTNIPTFDVARIQYDGLVVIAGRWQANKNISIVVNNKIVATERTDNNGEFVYTPKLAPGNYTIELMGVKPTMKSADKLFLYISDADYRNSVSLLMTKEGSKVMQSPSVLKDGDLTVSKIDYLDTGRIIVTGEALPRFRVSLSLDDKYVGDARVSDYKSFGVGADIGELKPGAEYNLTVRLHDDSGHTVATVNHNFIMPETTGDSDTFYTVRRGDCLWVIAKNFLRRGTLYTMIAERNSIDNPNLIYPKQLLQIPTK